MSQIMDENQTCKEMRSLRIGVKVQFMWQQNRVGLLCDQLRKSFGLNVTFNGSHEEEGTFLFNSA